MVTKSPAWVIASRIMPIVFILNLGSLSIGGDWPQFLGPDRNGVSNEESLISEWPTSGPDVLWKAPLGVGMSSIAVAGEQAFTMFQDDDHQYVTALNVADGIELWKTAIAPAYSNAMGHGPRATPTVTGDLVLAYSGEGVLACLSRTNGKLNWSVNVPKSFSGQPSEYGMSCSPLVFGETVVVQSGTRSAAVAAFSLTDGKLRWKTGQGTAGYSSPVMMTLIESPTIVAFVGAAVMGLDPATGQVRWNYEYVTDYDCNTATPVQLSNDTLLISSGENHGSTILKITGDASGSQKVSAVWESLGRDSQLRAEWQTPVIHDGHIYALDNIGSAGPITNLVCIRLSDMKTMWQKTRFGKGNLTLADGKLFLTNMNGELILVAASPDGFSELSRSAAVIETTRQAPLISNGRLFVRDDVRVVCIRVGK